MTAFKRVLRPVRRTPAGRLLNIPRRAGHAAGSYLPTLWNIARWSLTSKEDTNYTYELTPQSLDYIAHTIAVVVKSTPIRIRSFMEEARTDQALASRVSHAIRTSPTRHVADEDCRFGRRLGWYAVVRAVKPRVVVETGVDKGLGSVLLCSALQRNHAEGHPGRYYGTDINPIAGELLVPPYEEFGKIVYGDSIATLKALPGTIDVFINDSDHSADYEGMEYDVIDSKLSEHAIILGDNAHVTDRLMRFSDRTGRHFLFIRESPDGHWYRGGGIGIAFR